MNQKEILTLFLINSEPGIKDIYNLIKIFDRADFPGKIGQVLDRLIANEFIVVTDSSYNVKYATTNKGKDFVSNEFKGDEILAYILTLDNPQFLHELTRLYIEKANVELRSN